MAHLLFKLNGVPEDEAEEVRLLLEEHEIDCYETDSGRWGLGYAAIWMANKEQLDQAKELIGQYQKERYQKVSQEHQQALDSGERISRLTFFMQSPIRFSLLIIFAAALAYFTIIPFFP
jgi:hypothetical protein